MKVITLVLLLSLAAPALADPQPWRRSITETDRKRLAGLWRAWTTARAQVAAAGQADAWTAQEPLTDPAAGTGGDAPPPGRYRCRTVKLGTRTAGMPVWTMSETYPCRVEQVEDGLRFVREGGAQRTAGLLHADGDRQVYLGAVSLGNERGLFAYNADAERNQVGVLRRLGAARWRLELPWPQWESTLDVIDIVPA
jgi:hypothetical protein